MDPVKKQGVWEVHSSDVTIRPHTPMYVTGASLSNLFRLVTLNALSFPSPPGRVTWTSTYEVWHYTGCKLCVVVCVCVCVRCMHTCRRQEENLTQTHTQYEFLMLCMLNVYHRHMHTGSQTSANTQGKNHHYTCHHTSHTCASFLINNSRSYTPIVNPHKTPTKVVSTVKEAHSMP